VLVWTVFSPYRPANRLGTVTVQSFQCLTPELVQPQRLGSSRCAWSAIATGKRLMRVVCRPCTGPEDGDGGGGEAGAGEQAGASGRGGAEPEVAGRLGGGREAAGPEPRQRGAHGLQTLTQNSTQDSKPMQRAQASVHRCPRPGPLPMLTPWLSQALWSHRGKAQAPCRCRQGRPRHGAACRRSGFTCAMFRPDERYSPCCCHC